MPPDFHAKRDQVKAIREAAAELGVNLKVLPAELSVSGGEPLERRPSMLAAVQGVERGRYEGIIVTYQSRIGRDVEIEEAIWRRVEQAGGRIIMALDGIDATTVDGKMVRRIRSAINHAERDRHAERFAHLREWATAAGIWQRRRRRAAISSTQQRANSCLTGRSTRTACRLPGRGPRAKSAPRSSAAGRALRLSTWLAILG